MYVFDSAHEKMYESPAAHLADGQESSYVD